MTEPHSSLQEENESDGWPSLLRVVKLCLFLRKKKLHFFPRRKLKWKYKVA